MKKTIYIFLSFIVLQIALSSCATTNYPKTVKTKVGTFSYIERFRDYECNAKRGEADIRYYVRFDEETSQTDLSEAFKYLENLAQSLDENEAKVIAFADKKFDYKYNKILETYSTYAVYINLSKKPGNCFIEYWLYGKSDEWDYPLAVACNEKGEPEAAAFVG